MKKLYTLIAFILSLGIGQSQNCIPNAFYADSTAGVYPKPITPDGNSKGIDKPACIGKPYEFPFTVVIPDTIRISGFLVNLTDAKIDTTGAVSNLPDGITYACNPPNCVFPKKSIGCIVLKGTPTSKNTVGPYKPTIKLSVGTPFGYVPIDFPGSQFPGEYILTLLDENCVIATKNINVVNDGFFPNPNEGWINSREDHITDLRLMNQVGTIIAAQASLIDSKFILDENLPDGFYLLSWKSKNKSYLQKIILRRN